MTSLRERLVDHYAALSPDDEIPFVHALIDDVCELRSVIEGMCARYDDAVIRNKDASPLSKGMTLGVRHVFEKTLSASDARLRSIGVDVGE